MNDKRCPACDLLVDERASQCSCKFVFWDDTPEHHITRKRILVTFSLLIGAGYLGTWLSSAGLVNLTNIFTLSLVPFALLLLPNLRKQGSLALAMALLLVFWVSTLISTVWNETYPKRSSVDEFIARETAP